MVHSDLGHGHVLIDGQFVSQKISQIVQAMVEYDPRISVDWIPPEARVPGVAAFKVKYRPDNGDEYVMFHVKDEDEFDERQLARIIANDSSKRGGVALSDFEAYEAAVMRTRHQEWLDKMEEAQEIAKAVLATNKDTYKVNEHLTIKEGIPFNYNHIDRVNNRGK